MPIQLDIAASLTALSLIIGSSATLVAVLRSRKEPDSNENDKKAVAVSEIKNTTERVDILWEHIIDLREELDALRKEKEDLQTQIDELNAELTTEKNAHVGTRRKLDEALGLLAEKDKKIKELEEKLNGKLTI